MGEARRRQQAGNVKPDKRWHERKAIERHAKQEARRERQANAAAYPTLAR